MISYNTLPFVFLLFSSPLLGQGLSTPNGSVSANGTTDQVIVTGQTKLQNPNGRALIIERDNEDSWLMFHDPDNHWYSLGIDHSNSGLFTINSGGTLGAYPSFLMNSSGYIGIGGVNPINELDVNGRARFRRQGSSTSGFTIGGDALSLKGWGANNPYIDWISIILTR